MPLPRKTGNFQYRGLFSEKAGRSMSILLVECISVQMRTYKGFGMNQTARANFARLDFCPKKREIYFVCPLDQLHRQFSQLVQQFNGRSF